MDVLTIVDCAVGLYENECSKCHFKIRSYLACDKRGEMLGFKREATIKCPCCGKNVRIDRAFGKLIKPDPIKNVLTNLI